jgi:hypothetical protein
MKRVFQAIQYGAIGIVGLIVPAYLMAPSVGVGLHMGIYSLSSAFVFFLISYKSFCIKLPTPLVLLSFFLSWQFTYWLVVWLGNPDTWSDGWTGWTLYTLAALAGALVVVPLMRRLQKRGQHSVTGRRDREQKSPETWVPVTGVG